MASEDLIGVVTVTFNSAEVLPEFLQSISQQTHRQFILFVVDNASKDSTLHLLRDYDDERLTVISNQDNRGVAGGNNQGIRAALDAGCTSVLLLNNDTVFDPSLFAKLRHGLSKYQVAMICPKMMHYDSPDRIWAAGGAFQPWLAYRNVHYGSDEIDQGQCDQTRLITYVPTCCVLIRQELFQNIGLMDENYFVYMDDVDFMYRAMKAGAKLLYLPEAKLLHKAGSLTGVESPFSVRYCTRNRAYFMLKHFGIAGAVPMVMLYQFGYAAQFLLGQTGWGKYRAREKAVWEGIKLYTANQSKKG